MQVVFCAAAVFILYTFCLLMYFSVFVQFVRANALVRTACVLWCDYAHFTISAKVKCWWKNIGRFDSCTNKFIENFRNVIVGRFERFDIVEDSVLCFEFDYWKNKFGVKYLKNYKRFLWCLQCNSNNNLIHLIIVISMIWVEELQMDFKGLKFKSIWIRNRKV